MTQEQKNNPLHGVKLEALVTDLVDNYGFKTLAEELNLNCFKSNPSIKSTLKFLRRTEWAREKVERFYLYQYKGLPEPSYDDFDTPARQRTVTEKDKVNTTQKPMIKQTEKPSQLNPKSPWAKSKHLKK